MEPHRNMQIRQRNSTSELAATTNDFSLENKIGEGSFGILKIGEKS